jgi:hypothetical protein
MFKNTKSKEEKAFKKRNYKLQYNKNRVEIRKKLNQEKNNDIDKLKDEYINNLKNINNNSVLVDELNKEYDSKFKKLKKQHREQFKKKFNELYKKQKEAIETKTEIETRNETDIDIETKNESDIDTETKNDQVLVYALIESFFSQDN